MKIVKNYLLLVVIALAVLLRFYHLSSIPVSLNPDELAIGYNSYSIMTTGADEWGNKLPLAMRSFGDWKLPVYPILTMPLIAAFGLSEISIRLPSALAGIFSVLLIYLIAFRLFKNKTISLFSALFFAISPWSIIFSRGAFEPNLAVGFYLFGLFLFLKYLDQNKSWYLILSSVIFGTTLFIYHPFIVFTPLFVFFMLLYFRKKILKTHFLIPGGIFSLFIVLTMFALLQGSGQKLSAVGVFNDPHIIYERAEKFRADATNSPIVAKILYNRFTVTPYDIGQKYLLTFSPKFLFDGETTKLFYGIGGFGYIYLLDALFIFCGIVGLASRKEKLGIFLLGWILISPLPSAITTEAPSVSRLTQIVPPLMIVSAYGAYCLFDFLKKSSWIYKAAGVVIAVLFFVNFIYFVDQYFNHMNPQRGRFFNFGYREMVNIANKYPDKKVVVRGPENFPYIAFLFYNKYDPSRFREEVKYYPQELNGFVFVNSFGRYEFVNKINRKKIELNTIYFDNYKTGDKNLIYFPSKDPAFSYFIK